MSDSTIRDRIILADGREIVVRKIGPQDDAGLMAFFDSLGPDSLQRFLPHATSSPVIRRRIERATSGNDLVYLAWDGGVVAGYFFLWNFDEPVPLLGIGIADQYQGLKLGQKFMTILIEDAKYAKRDGIELTTMLDNDRAFHVYQKVGFQYIGNVENIAGDGKVVIERAMFLPLKDNARPMSGPHRCPD